jgi:hypothetical protein
VDECNAFAAELHARTGRLVIGYLPGWSYGTDVRRFTGPWWQSSYVAGSGPYRVLYPGNDSARWSGGGRRADLLQYTSSAVIAGQSTSDANAYPGTLDQLKAFIGGEDMALTNDEYNMIRNTGYLVTGLVNMEDPIVVPSNPDSSYPGASLPNLLAQAIRALEAGDGTGGGIDSATVAELKTEIRDAVADLGEGGAAQVRDDPDAT